MTWKKPGIGKIHRQNTYVKYEMLKSRISDALQHTPCAWVKSVYHGQGNPRVTHRQSWSGMCWFIYRCVTFAEGRGCIITTLPDMIFLYNDAKIDPLFERAVRL